MGDTPVSEDEMAEARECFKDLEIDPERLRRDQIAGMAMMLREAQQMGACLNPCGGCQSCWERMRP